MPDIALHKEDWYVDDTWKIHSEGLNGQKQFWRALSVSHHVPRALALGKLNIWCFLPLYSKDTGVELDFQWMNYFVLVDCLYP